MGSRLITGTRVLSNTSRHKAKSNDKVELYEPQSILSTEGNVGMAGPRVEMLRAVHQLKDTGRETGSREW